MRTSSLFARSLVLLVLSPLCGLLGCLPAEPIVEDPTEPIEPTPPTVVVALRCTDQWSIGPAEPLEPQSPLHFNPSKANPTGLLAIQLYTKISENNYLPYAYGLFDTWQNLSVELLTTHTYRIVASLVPDASAKLYRYAAGYTEPFLAGSSVVSVSNTFTYNTERAMSGLTAGAAIVVSGSSWKRHTRPSIDRCCAVLNDYTPSADQPAQLILRRVAFAIKASAPDLTEGTIELTLDGAPPIVLTSTEAVETVFSLLGAASLTTWLDPQYVDNVSCTAWWKKVDGSRVSLGPKEGTIVPVRRNYRIPIELYTRGKPNGMVVETEPSDWADQPAITL